MPGITYRLSHLLGGGHRRTNPPVARKPTAQARPSILDSYVHDAPSAEAALNIFEGEWSSKLPTPYEKITGPSELFDDARIEWMLEVLGGVRGLRVLELGPLEAGHTTMLERAGADAVTAVEVHSGLLEMPRRKGSARSRTLPVPLWRPSGLLGHLHRPVSHLCLASGVLYHMRQPVEVLNDMARVSDRLAIGSRPFRSCHPRRRAGARPSVQRSYPPRGGRPDVHRAPLRVRPPRLEGVLRRECPLCQLDRARDHPRYPSAGRGSALLRLDSTSLELRTDRYIRSGRPAQLTGPLPL